MAGSDAQILTTSLLGGVGVFSLLTCIFPKLIVGICGAIDRGDWETARAMQEKILRVRQADEDRALYGRPTNSSANLSARRRPDKSPVERGKRVRQTKIVTILKEQEML